MMLVYFLEGLPPLPPEVVGYLFSVPGQIPQPMRQGVIRRILPGGGIRDY